MPKRRISTKIAVSSGTAADIISDLDVSKQATQRAHRYIAVASASLGITGHPATVIITKSDTVSGKVVPNNESGTGKTRERKSKKKTRRNATKKRAAKKKSAKRAETKKSVTKKKVAKKTPGRKGVKKKPVKRKVAKRKEATKQQRKKRKTAKKSGQSQ